MQRHIRNRASIAAAMFLTLTIPLEGGQAASEAAPSAVVPAFRNGFPTAPDFFPIGVWLQSPSNAAAFRVLGINTFVGLWQGPTAAQLRDLAASGMFRLRMISRRPL